MKLGHRCVILALPVVLVSSPAGSATSSRSASSPPVEIAFDGWVAGPDGEDDYDIFTASSKGTAPENLSRAAFWQFSPAWSPDGRRVAYVSSSGLIVMDVGSREIDLIARHGRGGARSASGHRYSHIMEVEWSPDGTRLVVSWKLAGTKPATLSEPGDFSEIAVMNVDGSGVRTVVPPTSVNMVPDWSPDGGSIVFRRLAPNYNGASSSEIWTVSPSGARLTRVADSGWDEAPAWTPDGDILFLSQRDCPTLYGCAEIFRMEADGTAPTKLVDYAQDWGGDLEPDFIQRVKMTPDSSQLVVILQPQYRTWMVDVPFQLWLADLGGDQRTLLAQNERFMTTLDVRPRCTISGTAGRDVLVGTSGADLVCGLGGDDVIRGLGGNDSIFGHAGNDRILGGPGADIIVGNGGRDFCDREEIDYSRVC